jgi:ATP-dependent Clp protease ATP-binding subunit ClpA
MSTSQTNTIQAACNVLVPAMVSIVTYEAGSRVIDAAQKRFQLNETVCAVACIASSACLGPLLGAPLDRMLFKGNETLQRYAAFINFIALVTLGISRAIKLTDRKSPSSGIIDLALTNLLSHPNAQNFTPNQSLDPAVQTIEKSFNRRPGTQSMLLVGDLNQTDFIVNECAGRISKKYLPLNSPLLNKTMYSVHAATINGMATTDFQKLLNFVRDQKNSILVIDQIHLLIHDANQAGGRSSLLESYVSRGDVSILGKTTPDHLSRMQSCSLFQDLTPLVSKPLNAEGCFQAMHAKHLRNEFTSRFPLITLDEKALVYATLLSYNHVKKSFIIHDAAALVSDIVFAFKDTVEKVALDGETFLKHWKELYQQSNIKISLASLSPESKAFFNGKEINVDEMAAVVLEFNKQKKDARLGHTELPLFLTDMNEEAREGRYAPCIGRDEEIKLVIRTLTQPKNKSLVFVGEPGIGKTAVFEEIARRIAAGENSVADIKDLTFYWVDVNALTATDGIVGQLSTKVTEMINFSKQREGTCVLVIDELHHLRGAGRYRGNDTDLFEMVKNSLARDEIIVLGTANNYRWEPIVQEDPAINRRIRSHHMLPPTRQVCYEMLKTINDSGYYTKDYKPAYVKITNEAIIAAIIFSESYMKDQFLPDKATVLLSSAVSYYQQEAKNIEITPREIASVLYDIIKHRLNCTKDEFINTLLSPPKLTPKDDASSAELLSCADL